MNYTVEYAFKVFVNPIICLFGFFLSLLMILVFSCSHFKETSYKYLQVQAIFFAFNSLITIFQPIYFTQQYQPDLLLAIAYYFIILRIYVSSICEMIALYSNCLSGLSCLFILNNKFASRFILSILNHYYIITSSIGVFSSGLYSFQLFEYEFPTENGKLNKTAWYESDGYITVQIISVVLREFVSLVFLIIINTAMFLKINQIMKIKINLIRPISLVTKTSRSDISNLHNPKSKNGMASNLATFVDKRYDKIRRKQAVTIFINCSICFVGRLPIAIYFIERSFTENKKIIPDDQKDKHDQLFFSTAELFVLLSYIVSFFHFYFFNKRFANTLKQFFSCNK